MMKTYDPSNQFRFQCPIFKAETRIASCLALRDLVWRGEGPVQRKGCQCAMESGKCPIPVLVTKITRTKEDHHYSAEPKLGTLDHDVLERIGPVLTREKTIDNYGMSAGEEKLLLQANEDARKGVRLVGKKPTKAKAKEKPAAMEDVAAPEQVASSDANELLKAAQSGDMSAAINAEVSSANPAQ